MTFEDRLIQLDACEEAVIWVGKKGFKESWETCQRGDWMLWLAKELNIDLRVLTKAKVECAKLVEYLMKDERSIKALRVSEQFAEGKSTIEQLNAAASAAASAAYAAYAATAAASAAASAAYAATAYAAAAKIETLKKCADICRQYLTDEVMSKYKLKGEL